MSGTFPNPELFNSMQFISSIKRYRGVDGSNKQYDKFISQRWQVQMNSVPLTRAQWGAISSFILKQNGSAETFTITLPIVSTLRGTYPDDSNLKTDGSNNIKGSTQVRVDSTTAGDDFGVVGTLSTGDLIKFSDHDKVYQLTGSSTIQNFFGSPVATNLNIFPALVQDVANDTTVIHHSVPMKVRLLNENQDFTTNIDGTFNYKLDMVEEY